MKKKMIPTRTKKRRLFKFISEIPEILFAGALILFMLAILYFGEKPDGFIHNQLPGTMLDIGVLEF